MAASRRCSATPASKPRPSFAARWNSSAPWSRIRRPRPAPTSRRCSPPVPPEPPRLLRSRGLPSQRRRRCPPVASAKEPPTKRCRPGSRALRRAPRPEAPAGDRRWRRVGAMTLGAGAVAASSEDFRHSVSHTVGVIFQPAVHPTPATEHVQPSPSDVPEVPAIPAPGATSAATGYPGGPPPGRPRPARPAGAFRLTERRGRPRRQRPRPPSAGTAYCRRPGSAR